MESVFFMSEFSLKKIRRERFYSLHIQKLGENVKNPLLCMVLEVTDSLYKISLWRFCQTLSFCRNQIFKNNDN